MNELYKDLLSRIGENPDREGLLDTPDRAAKAMEEEKAVDLQTVVFSYLGTAHGLWPGLGRPQARIGTACDW